MTNELASVELTSVERRPPVEAGPIPVESTRIHAADPMLQRRAEWALRRFAEAGLQVRVADIHLHQNPDACGGHSGSFTPATMTIDVCRAEPKVILHEIAHAWTHDHVSDQQRTLYVASGGFESWNDPDTRWARRGSEDAADTIAWALMERRIEMPASPGPLSEINDRYRLLTGNDAPRFVFSRATVG